MKFSLFIIFIPTPDFPHFYYILGGNLGSVLYGDVSVMFSTVRFSQDIKLSALKNTNYIYYLHYASFCQNYVAYKTKVSSRIKWFNTKSWYE